MSIGDLIKVGVPEDRAEMILETSSIVDEYFHFRTMTDMGIFFNSRDIDFDKSIIFSWIKEELNGRKT